MDQYAEWDYRQYHNIQQPPPASLFKQSLPYKQSRLPYKQSNLKREHSSTDDNNDKLKCRMCSQVFASTELCREHERSFHNITIETPKKGHACEFCDKVLSTTSNLNTHIRIKHAKTSNLMCPRCQQPFSYRKRYEKHVSSCIDRLNWDC